MGHLSRSPIYCPIDASMWSIISCVCFVFGASGVSVTNTSQDTYKCGDKDVKSKYYDIDCYFKATVEAEQTSGENRWKITMKVNDGKDTETFDPWKDECFAGTNK